MISLIYPAPLIYRQQYLRPLPMCLIVLHACVCVHSCANNVSRVGVQHTHTWEMDANLHSLPQSLSHTH